MNLAVQTWLQKQSKNTTLSADVQEFIAQQLQGQPNGATPVASSYLKARSTPVPVGDTGGKWNLAVHKTLFTGGVDEDFEKWNGGKEDAPTNATNGLPYDLIKDGTYMQIIPDLPTSFFAGRNQALQVVHDNPALVKEVLEQDRRLHIPFINKKGEKCVAGVFRRGGELKVNVNKFSNDSYQAEDV